jgi:hypothetical protein
VSICSAVLILDAGSSGTRLYQYRLSSCSSTSGHSCKDSKVNLLPKLALCTAAKGANLAKNLGLTITRFGDKMEQKETEVIGGATAGLRNLPMREVNQVITDLAANIPKSSHILELLDGVDEAYYEFLAVNSDKQEVGTSITQVFTNLGVPSGLRSFISAGGASAQMAFYIGNTQTLVDAFHTFISDVATLMETPATNLACIAQDADLSDYPAARQAAFVGYAQFENNVVTQQHLWASRGHSGKVKNQGALRHDCVGSGKHCVALISFLAGSSSDAKKPCIDYTTETSPEHNLWGGAKETWHGFVRFMKKKIDANAASGITLHGGVDLANKDTLNAFFENGGGQWAGRAFVKPGGMDDATFGQNMIDLLTEFARTDAFFVRVASYLISTLTHNINTNFYVGGSFFRFNEWSATQIGQYLQCASVGGGCTKFIWGWSGLFMYVYKTVMGITDLRGMANVSTKLSNEGDWSAGLALSKLQQVALKCPNPWANLNAGAPFGKATGVREADGSEYKCTVTVNNEALLLVELEDAVEDLL